MIIRILFIFGIAVLGIAVGGFVPELSEAVRTGAGLMTSTARSAGGRSHIHEASQHSVDERRHEKEAGRGRDEAKHEEADGVIKMAADQISAAKIDVAPVSGGTLARRLIVPGSIAADSNRVARIAAKVVGTVAELRKQLGDPVTVGEAVAALDSREVADAKSEYISAQVNFELQKTLFEREQSLVGSKIITEVQFLRTRNSFTEAQLRGSLARQKLLALHVSDYEVSRLSRDSAQLQRYELRSPITGRVVERLVDLGAPVGGEGQAKEIYVVADLSSVWVELSVPVADLPAIKEGQRVTIASKTGEEPSEGKIVFISPLLNRETRSARVIAAIANTGLRWRPGSYVSAQVTLGERAVDLRVPRSAFQTISGKPVVFVRTQEGFEKREVALADADDEAAEIAFGLNAGETVAITNTFLLKADLGKAEAEHSD